MSRRAGAALLSFCLTAAALGAAVAIPPAPERYVTDNAGVLPADRAEAVNARLERYEKETSNKILVWIERRIPENTTLEEFTVAASRRWAAGQKGKNNGAVFFVFTEDRKMRIEVGYGLEGALPDAIAHRIQEHAVPGDREGWPCG